MIKKPNGPESQPHTLLTPKQHEQQGRTTPDPGWDLGLFQDSKLSDSAKEHLRTFIRRNPLALLLMVTYKDSQ